MSKRIVFMLLSCLTSSFLAAPAHATIGDAGACVVDITISFTSAGVKMKSATLGIDVEPEFTSPSYSMTAGGAIDLSSDTGSQACVYGLGGLAPFRTTTITTTPTPTGDLWTCEAVNGSGSWTQSWSPTPPAAWNGLAYTITGTWGDWQMRITSTSGLVPVRHAVIDLSFKDADDADALWPLCLDGSNGVATLTLTGIELFVEV